MACSAPRDDNLMAEAPKPGQVRVLPDCGGNTELLHLAESITAAELWIAREDYRNARLEIVGAEDGDRAGGADLVAFHAGDGTFGVVSVPNCLGRHFGGTTSAGGSDQPVWQDLRLRPSGLEPILGRFQ